jgi:hypothetical protein
MEPLGQVSGASFTCPICQKAFSIRKCPTDDPDLQTYEGLRCLIRNSLAPDSALVAFWAFFAT